MNVNYLVLVVSLVVSTSSFAMSLEQAQEHASHIDRYGDSSAYHGGMHYRGDGYDDVGAAMGAERAQAHADLRAAQAQAQSSSIANYGVKQNPEGNPVTMISGIKNNPEGHSTIRVSASTLSPSTKVQTNQGIVTASSLPKDTQVTVPFNSAFTVIAHEGNAHSSVHSTGEHEHGNGANNAAATHSAHGLGGNEGIGGGRSGGGFHY